MARNDNVKLTTDPNPDWGGSIMPRIRDIWYHAEQEGSERIHFTIEKAEGGVRRLYADRGSALYDVLAAHYTARQESNTA